MGFFSNLFTRKNVYFRTMRGIRVYDWEKSMDRKNPLRHDYPDGLFSSNSRNSRELIEEIINDMVANEIKKAIIINVLFRNLKFQIYSFPHLTEKYEFAVFSMEIESRKFRILFFDKTPPPKLGYWFPRSEDWVVYIGIEPIENGQHMAELNLWNEYNKVFT